VAAGERREGGRGEREWEVEEAGGKEERLKWERRRVGSKGGGRKGAKGEGERGQRGREKGGKGKTKSGLHLDNILLQKSSLGRTTKYNISVNLSKLAVCISLSVK